MERDWLVAQVVIDVPPVEDVPPLDEDVPALREDVVAPPDHLEALPEDVLG